MMSEPIRPKDDGLATVGEQLITTFKVSSSCEEQ